MIKLVKGDFFDFDADIRINTVNCVGVMGAGVALAFKKKYPDMFKKYEQECKKGLIKPGLPSVWKNEDMFSKSIEIINFPTKKHWRNPSEYEYIESGLKWLSEYLKNKNELTITLPALGCGHGGLDWSKVKQMIEKYLANSHHNILVFEPSSSIRAGEKTDISDENIRILLNSKIEVINSKSNDYPEGLRFLSEKDLFVFGCRSNLTRYDVSIISSSKPNCFERQVIEKLISYCKDMKFTILFGGSTFDKKMAIDAANNKDHVGVFLPSGILYSAQKLMKISVPSNLTLLSTGDPFDSFDRKAYMPSVLSRIFLAKRVVFTTERLEWVSKQAKFIINSGAEYYYVNHPELSEKDALAIEEISPIKIIIDNEQVDFDCIN